MAVLNPLTGRTVQGVGKNPCYVDGSRIVTDFGASACWLDEVTVIYITGDMNDPTIRRVESYNLDSGLVTVLATHGANFIKAGGGRWAGWLGDGVTGVFGDITNAYAGLKDIGPDGTIAITPLYTDGLGCRLLAFDGRVTDGPREAMEGFRVIGPTSAIWTVKGQIHALNARVPARQIGPAYSPKRCVIKNEEWIVYLSGAGIVAHPYDSLVGYRLNAAGQIFYMDAIAWDNQIRIAYATDDKDSAAGLILTDIDLTAPRTQLPNIGAGGNFDLANAQSRVFLTGGSSSAAVTTSPRSVISAQNGLLEDEIAYRLSLLATNILEPLKQQYPGMVIKSGFRQSNVGVGQHELGEAADIQLQHQTDELLYDCAVWIRDHLPFDQLILNFTKLGDGKPWIHVSFSPISLRYDVLTKDYADTFHDGLGYVTDFTAEEAAEVNRQRAETDALILDAMTKIQARDARGTKTTIVTDEVTDLTSEQNTQDAPKPQYVAVIQGVKDALWPYIQGLSDEEKAFQILIRVVWQLRGEGVGFIITPVNSRGMQISSEKDDFFINWSGARGPSGLPFGGYNISGRYVGFSNGDMFQILGPQGVFTPQWTAAPRDTTNLVSASRWKPPIYPGDEYTTAWITATVGSTPADSSVP